MNARRASVALAFAIRRTRARRFCAPILRISPPSARLLLLNVYHCYHFFCVANTSTFLENSKTLCARIWPAPSSERDRAFLPRSGSVRLTSSLPGVSWVYVLLQSDKPPFVVAGQREEAPP
jgi:hypothetical protein